VTGFDIIFFWVARMIVMGLKFAGEVPFREVYIHGLVRDHEGQKMSKSKGNILDPLDLIDGVDLDTLLAKRTEGLMQTHLKTRIEEVTRAEFPEGIRAFGTDALRLTFASLATTGRDIRFDLGRIDGYHRFCNKLWNASQYVLTQIDGPDDDAPTHAGAADRWIRSRLEQCVREVHENVAIYRFDLVTQALYEFTWHEFCDWYLELTKPVLGDAAKHPERAAAARATLAEVLGALLRLLHPLIPFVTEELWLALCAKRGVASATIMLEPLPEAGEFANDPAAEEEIAWLKALIVAIRQIRGEMNISPGKTLTVRLAGAGTSDRARVTANASYIEKLARITDVGFVDDAATVRGAATALLGEMQILVPLAGLIDVTAESDRLEKQIGRVHKDLDGCRRKLGNERFVGNAPDDIVAKERARAEELEQRLGQLELQLARVREIQ
jgi:valyl-tRNA synthetase